MIHNHKEARTSKHTRKPKCSEIVLLAKRNDVGLEEVYNTYGNNNNNNNLRNFVVTRFDSCVRKVLLNSFSQMSWRFLNI